MFIKRDDLIPFSFGGNKARKAINFFREIDDGNYDCVVTYGSSSSNHCRIISNLAAKRRIACYIISPEESSYPTFNSQMMKKFGAEFKIVAVDKVHDTIEDLLQKLRNEGKNPYFIAGGGHGDLGTQAYVDCYSEIVDYERKSCTSFDYIFFASGTGTTQAGLVCGKLINGDKRNIIGISIARKNPRGRQVIIESVKEYFEHENYIGDNKLIDDSVQFIDEYTGSGYGKDNSEIQNTIEEVLINYGIPLDSTYTGKAFTGMKKYIESNKITGKNILFIHTGGTPLFFDDIK